MHLHPRSSGAAPAIVVLVCLLAAASTHAQVVTLPPSGDNQKASVIQHIGLVEVRIDYSSTTRSRTRCASRSSPRRPSTASG